MDDLTIFDFIKDECAILSMASENLTYPLAGYKRENDTIYTGYCFNDFKWVWEDKKVIFSWGWVDNISEKFEEIGKYNNIYIDLSDVIASGSLSSNIIFALECMFRSYMFCDFDANDLSVQDHYREFSKFCREFGFFISMETYDDHGREHVFYDVTNCCGAMEKTRAIVFLLSYLPEFKPFVFEYYLSTNDDLRCMFESYKIKKSVGLVDSEGTENKKRRL